ncbi:type II CRISPR-associated endonuclease Cas1 [Microbulbifer sp. JMSA004]|uniref:type II CRISPR-associated endonuclease Cas1 n=1 Tax=Microbulbifer sp. JMSA004 TaxID=3243370 RepID=UPI00403A1292
MSEQHILLIENPCSLSIHLGCLRICRENEDALRIPPQDIAVICLHHFAIRISVAVLQALADAGAIVIITDSRHHPAGALLPEFGRGQATLRLRQQLALEQSGKTGALWRKLVAARLGTQAKTLQKRQQKSVQRLLRLSKNVKDGDPANLEGQGAKIYWRELFGTPFQREKHGATDPLNARLNFGYTIIRSLIARELAIASLRPELGLGHHSQENPFNLADDFLEAYRFLVEDTVASEGNPAPQPLDAESRRQLLDRIYSAPIQLQGKDFRLPAAVKQTVNSFIQQLEDPNKKPALLLPDHSETA